MPHPIVLLTDAVHPDQAAKPRLLIRPLMGYAVLASLSLVPYLYVFPEAPPTTGHARPMRIPPVAEGPEAGFTYLELHESTPMEPECKSFAGLLVL